MFYYNKFKWILGILMVFVLIIATNQIDSNNFSRIKHSIDTIYEDRLVASDIIYDMTLVIHDKEVALLDQNITRNTNAYNVADRRLTELVTKFATTKLTNIENETFSTLKKELVDLSRYEENMDSDNIESESRLRSQLGKVKTTLLQLSKIQIDEGQRQVSISTKASDKIELFTQMEFYLLIVIALLIQIIVMYRPKES